jgi:hypothetical protein
MTNSRKSIPTEGRSIWWWFLCFPGAVVMWLRYMNPESVKDSFGTARRRNVPLFEFITTMALYGLVLFAVTHLEVTKNAIWVLTLPFVTIFHLLFGN